MQRIRSLGLLPGPGISIGSSPTKMRPSGAHSTKEGQCSTGMPAMSSTFQFGATLGSAGGGAYLVIGASAAGKWETDRNKIGTIRRGIFRVMMGEFSESTEEYRGGGGMWRETAGPASLVRIGQLTRRWAIQ